MRRIERILSSFYGSNTYILFEDECIDVWLIDCGDYHKVKNVLSCRNIMGVLITHTHIDHIYGLNDMLYDFPNALIYTNAFGKQALRDTKLNLSRYHIEVPDFLLNKEAEIKLVDENDEINLFSLGSAKVLSTPGHDKSSLSYVIGRSLFTGDSYIPGSKLISTFPNSNKKDAIVSYNRLVELSRDYCVYPGHGEVS